MTKDSQTTRHKYNCDIFGGSDYCPRCGRDMCRPLPHICVQKVQQSDIAAFGCYLETRMMAKGDPNPVKCNQWCHSPQCAFALKEEKWS